ncbi:hypothetical protein NLI96_g4158 [Meripilus lineatus]|uniref:Cyclase n=1 Tax=Meripilus lineatus TaxID=2056292 RepID=A0AAD5V7G0_9APHY|nr:hypothetical protein NLI96_g4158 [Physisporinus lineatus]
MTNLPNFDQLPTVYGQTGCAWDIWGRDDELGTVNLLTDTVVRKSAKEINKPINFFPQGQVHLDPANIDQERIKYGIHNWSQHGICGRGVLIDLVDYYTQKYGKLHYDPWTSHSISLQDILDCAKSQNVTFKRADILILRIGYIQKYHSSSTTQEMRDSLCRKPETFAGIEQTEDMKRFLWDNHLVAIASDQPVVENWPPPEGTPTLHQTLLPFWGMPIGMPG